MVVTPEMLEEIEDGLIERTGGWCVRIDQAPLGQDDLGAQAFGVVIVDARGNALVVECRIADDGEAQVTASKHDAAGSRLDPFVFTVDGSVLVTT